MSKIRKKAPVKPVQAVRPVQGSNLPYDPTTPALNAKVASSTQFNMFNAMKA